MDLNAAAWRKSSYSGGNGGQCVEVATTDNQNRTAAICAIRDSKDPRGPVLAFAAGPWRQFTAEIKARWCGQG